MQEIIQILIHVGGNQCGADGRVIQVVAGGGLCEFNILMSQKIRK
jgi:hypothetical protein